ncbi:MAG: CHAT domain-containing protein [Calditrichia bacterium]
MPGQLLITFSEADLVTLSACQTGLGQVFWGKGTIGFTGHFWLPERGRCDSCGKWMTFDHSKRI